MWEQYRPNLRREDTHIQPSVFHYRSRPRTTSTAYRVSTNMSNDDRWWWTQHMDWHQMMDMRRTWLQEDRRRWWRRCTTFLVRYWSRSEHSRLPCRGAQALVDHQWSLTTNCGTRGWLGKVSLNSIWMQVEMILYLACITRSGTCSRRWRSVSPNKPGEQKIMK